MNKKKFAAFMMAAALSISSMAVFAAPEDDASGTPDVSVSANTPTTVTGTGTSEVVDTSTQYSVLLPTSSALDFKVDPQGLLNLKNGSSAKLEDLVGAGAIVSADGAGAFIKNQSSSDIVVTAKMSLTSEADSQPTLIDSVASVSTGDADTTNNMLLLVIPGTESVASIADYTASTTVVPVTGVTGSSTTDVKFFLHAADYVISKDASGNATYELADGDDNYDSVSFKIGGQVNTYADWSAYNGKDFTLTAIFSFDDAADGDEDNVNEDAYGLLVDGDTIIEDYESIAVAVGPQVSLSATGLISITGLTADVNVVDGNKDILIGVNGKLYVIDNKNVAWDTKNWSRTEGGTLNIQLKEAYNVYNNKTVDVKVTLSDKSVIDCATVLDL